MRTFSKVFAGFVAQNPSFLVFLLGFLVFLGSLSAWSVRLAGLAAGLILMGVAVYPYLRTRQQ